MIFFSYKRSVFFLSIICGMGAALVNFETIRTFPSWFDEAYFANMAFNLSNGKGIVSDLIPGFFEGNIYTYGPIYFYLEASLIDNFGLLTLLFRLPNFLAAYLAILVLSEVLKHSGMNSLYRIFFAVAAVVDVSINRNLVGGRMDMIAVLFVVLALYAVVHRSDRSGPLAYLRWLGVGVMCGAAYLTTPRALFLFPVVVVLGLRRLFGNRACVASDVSSVVLVLLALVGFTGPVGWWILHVGGFQVYASLFTTNAETAQHIAPSFFRSSYDNVAIGLMITLCLINYRKVLKNALLIGLILTYISFSLFVKEVGPYAAMIMPFVLAIVIILIANSIWSELTRVAALIIITVPGILLLGVRGLDVYLNSKCRDGENVLTIASAFMQDKKHIVAPFKYYFLLEKSNRDLVTFEYSKVDRNIVMQNADVVFTKMNLGKELEENGLHQVAQLACKLQRVPLLPSTFYDRSAFDEVIFQR